jgi:hypothetical protein
VGSKGRFPKPYPYQHLTVVPDRQRLADGEPFERFPSTMSRSRQLAVFPPASCGTDTYGIDIYKFIYSTSNRISSMSSRRTDGIHPLISGTELLLRLGRGDPNSGSLQPVDASNL